jgi:hypothetical protein
MTEQDPQNSLLEPRLMTAVQKLSDRISTLESQRRMLEELMKSVSSPSKTTPETP